MILVDWNVIIDALMQDPMWRAWSEAALIDVANRDEIAINPIIHAELASGFATMAALDRDLGAADFLRLALPYEAGFVAGRAFVGYRRRGGVRTPPPPDFISGCTLLPRISRCWRATRGGMQAIFRGLS
jgi:predicted nucleic acid-binding protein